MEPTKITLVADLSQVEIALDELRKMPLEIVQAFFNSLESGAQLVSVDRNCLPTPGTNNLRVILKPAVLLSDFIATARARNGEVEVG
jgi:hypothetical protein